MTVLGEKVLFFGDFGIDDIFALIYSSYSKQIDVVGIVADYGNVSKEKAVANARFLQQLFDITDIPIFGGASKSLTGSEPEYYPTIHGEGGLGPFEILEEMGSNFENFHEIVPLINKYGDELTIVSVGRLTSLATAFIFFSNVMKKINKIYIMGGAFHYPGNVTPVAEANIYGDPYAANIVFTNSPVKINVFPLNVTHQAIVTPPIIEYVHSVIKQVDHQMAEITMQMYTYYYQAYKEMMPTIAGTPLHDLLVIWALEKPGDVRFKEVPVKIITNKGESFGQTIGDFRERRIKADYPIHKVAVDFNYARYINSFVETFISEANHKQSFL
ncbi:nucleoside hydrolase [Bacillus sp. V59.32b]|uniref:nucleoside hydrolase n=1 Tax=Bacillus sp. V59.32b TaxID=1758642 RepID=UPI000E3D0A2D|nr:nucleoside hydrolase [Bacillus sp. V59.32b]RFU61707.1 nucleoside hydrolase [Bacillus sp. V59.32b]